MNTFSIFTTLLLLLLNLLAFALKAHSQPASGPINITAILEKSGQFGTLIKLLKTTQVADQINNQLKNSNSGLTIFAPTDNAFSNLLPGTLNSLTDQQKVSLIQFHMLPNVVSMAQFQTVSNPVRTQAGDVGNGKFPLNVTTMGSSVNISTGIVNTTVSNTLYSDSQLVVYQVDKVLLPLEIFRPSVAPAPAPSRMKKKKGGLGNGPSSSPDGDSSADSSSAFGLRYGAGVGLVAALSLVWSTTL